MNTRVRHGLTVGVLFGILASSLLVARWAVAPTWASGPEDYKTWGEDHVSDAVPEYMTGTECLFCHRDYVGPRWGANSHNRAVRLPAEDSDEWKSFLAHAGNESRDEVMLLGSAGIVRYLKKLDAYGQAAIHSTLWQGHADAPGEVADAPGAHPGWDEKQFNQDCAGCHASAIDTETASFGTLGLDCYVCHGPLEVEHAGDASGVLFAKGQPIDPRVVIATCGQCHLRGGKSQATGRPFATNFVVGDNLFRDFAVDFSDQNIKQMDPIDRHVFENSRDVLIRDQKDVTCITCHSVHGESSAAHMELEVTDSCYACHQPGKELSDVLINRHPHHPTCQY